MIFTKKNTNAEDSIYNDKKIPCPAIFENEPWFIDLLKLSNDELMRIYSNIMNNYEFAKNAWYIPLGDDQRCPIMIAKGHKTPNTPEKMGEFQEVAKSLEEEYRRFIDAWDFEYITKKDIKKAILAILQLRSIEIIEYKC